MKPQPVRISRNALRCRTAAFTMMEIIVVVAIVIVLIAISIPAYAALQQRKHKQVALEKIRSLGGAMKTYASQNNGLLPAEDADGPDTWRNAAKPESKDAWYNALPRLLGRKGAGDYANSPKDFYTDENILFLPGANYPDQKKLIDPLFAIAFNSRLQRNDPSGGKERARLDQITHPSRTVAFLEQGVLNENRTLAVQTKRDYDGSPKGSAKSFVGRYWGKGVLYFFDGRAELIAPGDVLTETGDFQFPQTNVVWTRTPEENPNKDDSADSSKGDSKK